MTAIALQSNRKGLRVYGAILHSTMQRPRTVAALCALHGLAHTSTSQFLRRMHDKGLAHIGGWQRRRGFSSPLWAYGPGRDAPVPLNREGRPCARQATKPLPVSREQTAFANLIFALADPQTIKTLRELTGISICTLRLFLQYMRERGAVRVAEWDITSKARPPMYALGTAADAPEPKRIGRQKAQQLRLQRRFETNRKRIASRYVIHLTTGHADRVRRPVTFNGGVCP